MLVLNRKKGQAIAIGDVRVVVMEIHRSTVKLAIDAPRGVLVLRDEAVDREAKPKEGTGEEPWNEPGSKK